MDNYKKNIKINYCATALLVIQRKRFEKVCISIILYKHLFLKIYFLQKILNKKFWKKVSLNLIKICKKKYIWKIKYVFSFYYLQLKEQHKFFFIYMQHSHNNNQNITQDKLPAPAAHKIKLIIQCKINRFFLLFCCLHTLHVNQILKII